MNQGTVVRIAGLDELRRDFRRISKDCVKVVDDAIIEAMDPIKVDAESLALSEISNMAGTPFYATMRIGVSKQDSMVYLVPGWRRRSRKKKKWPRQTRDGWKMVKPGPRPNLGTLLADEAMYPARDRNKEKVMQRVDDALGHLFDRNGFD